MESYELQIPLNIQEGCSLHPFVEVALGKILHQEKEPEHAEEADTLYGIVDAKRCQRHGGKGSYDADRDGIVATNDAQEHLAAITPTGQIQGKAGRKNEDLGIPKRGQDGPCRAGNVTQRIGNELTGIEQTGWRHVIMLQDAERRTNGKADDHGPASHPEEALQVAERNPKEGDAQRDGESAMGIAAEDAHQEHKKIPIGEILATNAPVLPNEKRHDALRTEFHQGLFVAQEKLFFARAKQHDEDARKQYAKPCLVHSCQSGSKPNEEEEEKCGADIDNPRFPSVPSRHRQPGQGNEQDKAYPTIAGKACVYR